MSKATHVLQHNDIANLQQMWQSGALPHEVGSHQGTVAHDE